MTPTLQVTLFIRITSTSTSTNLDLLQRHHKMFGPQHELVCHIFGIVFLQRFQEVIDESTIDQSPLIIGHVRDLELLQADRPQDIEHEVVAVFCYTMQCYALKFLSVTLYESKEGSFGLTSTFDSEVRDLGYIRKRWQGCNGHIRVWHNAHMVDRQ